MLAGDATGFTLPVDEQRIVARVLSDEGSEAKLQGLIRCVQLALDGLDEPQANLNPLKVLCDRV